MPTCVQEIGPATAAVTGGRGRTTTVRRIAEAPSAKPINEGDQRVLAMVEGNLSLRSLVDVSAMKESDVLAIVDRLVSLGLLALE